MYMFFLPKFMSINNSVFHFFRGESSFMIWLRFCGILLVPLLLFYRYSLHVIIMALASLFFRGEMISWLMASLDTALVLTFQLLRFDVHCIG